MMFEMIMLGILCLVLLIVGYLIIETFVIYKYEFTAKMPTNGVPIVIRTRAREKKDNEGNVYWQLLWKRTKVPVPPAEARGINRRGKFYVEGWILEDGQVQYEIHPSPNAVDVLSTNQRIMLANQFRKAEKERVKGWKDIISQAILPLGFGILITLVVIVGMVQWTDINKPGIQFADKMVQLEQSRLQQVQIMQEIKQDVQIIKSNYPKKSVEDIVEDKPPN